MGDYTRQTENYARRERTQNPQKTTQNQPAQTGVVYTCWRCNKNFDLPSPAKPDTVRCPYCNMVHGLITSK